MSATPIPWTINGIETVGLIGEQPGVRPGATGDYAFGFPGGEAGRQAYNDVLDLTRNAGQYDTYETIGGVFYFREQTTGTSPLVHIVPDDMSPTGTAVWALIEDFDNPTTYSDARLQLSLSVFIIALGESYESEIALRTAREVSGP